MIVIDEEQSFDKITRITIVSNEGVEFERYNLYNNGVVLSLQDDGRTPKIFPRTENK